VNKDDAVFNEFKETDICYAIHEAQLSRSTVENGVGCMPDDTKQQLRQDLKIC
jgi:hypothetical protein